MFGAVYFSNVLRAFRSQTMVLDHTRFGEEEPLLFLSKWAHWIVFYCWVDGQQWKLLKFTLTPVLQCWLIFRFLSVYYARFTPFILISSPLSIRLSPLSGAGQGDVEVTRKWLRKPWNQFQKRPRWPRNQARRRKLENTRLCFPGFSPNSAGGSVFPGLAGSWEHVGCNLGSGLAWAQIIGALKF